MDSSKKEPATESKEEKNGISTYLKSLEVRGISETEICAYFMVEELTQIDMEQIEELRKIAINIESGTGEMTVEKFKIEAAEKYAMMLEMKK